VLKMLILHELEEIIIGDLTPFDKISKEEKLKIGAEAVSKILDGLVKKEEYEMLLDEFNAHITNESIYAFCCDKLEADLQAKIYSQKGYSNIYDERNKSLLNDGSKNLADLFIDFDIQKCRSPQAILFGTVQTHSLMPVRCPLSFCFLLSVWRRFLKELRSKTKSK